MANEITMTIRFDVTNGNYSPGAVNINALQLDQANAGVCENIQTVGTTTGQSLTLSNISSTDCGWILMRNLDATNYVEYGPQADTGFCGRMKASEPALFRVTSGATVYVRANTAACDVYYRWLKN